ncbi:M14 family metallopeptidase [Sphingomonas oryzagri]|uniref:M14 family metallopeptidase n=1 Tax=Sphingomonas oryzagri TaxID=3042314 RepID=A0ABT6MX65_9SPHN|nr:M14 family metallopeptidase [Sphingomonas oryzagri]MDH7637643.1 M14 family metallopeptidase [Sphingomonas oryzagri]
MFNSADSFSPDYAAARSKFLEHASAHGGGLESIRHPERGPDGAELTTDVAWFGPRSADKVLVMISATHGVEGFCGSGSQIDFLRRGEVEAAPDGVAILMIHAINPYGFAWIRRTTHENIDLNRNWIDFARPLPVNDGYETLHDDLCPSTWDQASQDQSQKALAAFAEQHGEYAMRRAVTGGQYRHPDGLHYGGVGPSWSRETQTRVFQTYLDQAGMIAILDYHTGLGPWGYGEQIVTAPVDSDITARARDWFGAGITSIRDGSSSAADLDGDGLSAAPALLSHAKVTAVALEFGTKPSPEVRAAMRADNWLHSHGDPLSPQGQAIKRELRDAFYGDSDDWKGLIAGQSLLACRQAMRGLASSPAGATV